jgi:hypothetical protein
MKLKKIYFTILIVIISILVSVGIAKLASDSQPVIPEEPVQIDCCKAKDIEELKEEVLKIQTNKGQNEKKEVLVGSNTQEPAVQKPAELQSNQTQTEVIVPNQTFNFIIEKDSITSQEVPTQEMAKSKTEPTYTVTKEGEIIKSDLLIGDLQKFVASLNTYLTWKKKANSASVEELTEMLSSNGYKITEK